MSLSKQLKTFTMYVCIFIQHGRKVSDFSLSGDKPRKNSHLARLSYAFIKIN